MKKLKHSAQELARGGKFPGAKRMGFSLVELMVVVAIIGILVTLALPTFHTFVARARMGEAIHNLGVINSLQKSYRLHYEMFGEDSVYWDALLMGNMLKDDSKCTDTTVNLHQKNKLGFRVEDCSKLRYDYYGGGEPNDRAENLAGDQRIYPGCSGSGSSDIWTLHRNTTPTSALEHTQDIIEKCK